MTSTKKYSIVTVLNLNSKLYKYNTIVNPHPYISAFKNLVNKTASEDLVSKDGKIRKCDIALLLVRINEYKTSRNVSHKNQLKLIKKLEDFYYG